MDSRNLHARKLDLSVRSLMHVMQTKLLLDLAQNVFEHADIDTKLIMETAFNKTFKRSRVSHSLTETTFLTPPEYRRLDSGNEIWRAVTKSRRFEHIYIEQHTEELKRYYILENKPTSHCYREICACGVYQNRCHCTNTYWSRFT